MTGKRILTVFILSLTILAITACGFKEPQSSIPANSPAAGSEDAQTSQEPAATAPAPTAETEPRVIAQKDEKLPGAEFLSTYPGVLKCMSLALEQILKVLGPDFELYEDKVRGYDIYRFPAYNLAIEYDTIGEKLYSVSVDGVKYYVYSGTIKSCDIDNDGKNEEIAAYEDENLNGRVMVFGDDGLIMAQQTTDYFNGRCDLSLITGYGPEKESLIVLDTGSEQGCAVFSYKNGSLESLVPPNQEDAAKGAEAALGGSGVLLFLPGKGLTYDCPVPGWLANSYPSPNTPLQYRLSTHAEPVITDNNLSLRIRHSLEVKYYEDSIGDGTETCLDVARVTDEYQYLGGGKWRFLSTTGGPKYDKDNMLPGLSADDFTVGKVKLLAPAADAAAGIGLDLSGYNEDDLLSGVICKTKDVCVGITDKVISYISLEKGSGLETARGLKAGDSRQRAQDLYGLPDKGYPEDPVWTYYFMRRENMGEGGYLLADTLNIEFEGDVVSKIWMSKYMPDY